jgi:ABC-type phosphate/phosphonate transport system substrate-binding protein
MQFNSAGINMNRHALRMLAFLALACIFNVTAYAESKTLSLGVFPYVNTGKLIKHQAVLHQFLRKQLDKHIDFVTAPDFKQYVDRVRNTQYDLIYAPPHLAWYCEKRGLYTPLALTKTKIQGVYIVNKTSPYYQLSDLKGQKISLSTVASRLSLLRQLLDNEVNTLAIKNLNIIEAKTHNNSIFSLIKKDVDVTLTGVNIWKNLKPEAKEQLRRIGETTETPGFVIMARPSLAKQIKPLFNNIDKDFAAALAKKKYLFVGLKTYHESMLNGMEAYTQPFE